MRLTLLLLALAPPFVVGSCAGVQGGTLTPEALRPEPAVRLAPGLEAAPSQEAVLVPGSWAAPVRERIEEVIRGAGRADRPLDERPVAVLDFDGTCIRNDLGEALLVTAIERRALVVDETLLASVPPDLGQEELRRAAARLAELPADAPLADLERDAAFLAWRKKLVAVYHGLREREGGAAAVSWLARTLAGLTPGDVRALTREALAAEQQRPLGTRALAEHAVDDAPLLIASGIRYPDEMRDLAAALQRHGFDVWVVSASNQWTVEVGAQPLGIAPHHVIGVRLATDPDGRLRPEVVPPLTWGPGKVEAVKAFIGRPPTLVVGDGASDRELLGTATALAVLIDSPEPNQELRAAAEEEGWAFQPPFEVAP